MMTKSCTDNITSKFLPILLLSTLLFGVIKTGITAQSPSRQIINTHRSSQLLPISPQLSSTGYLAGSYPFNIIDLESNFLFNRPFVTWTSRWLNQTVIYQHSRGTGSFVYEDSCDSHQELFGIYDAAQNSSEEFCIDSPFSNSVTERLGGYLQRDPFDNYTIFANNRFLIDLRLNSLRDISSYLPTQINSDDVSIWLAHGQTWWDLVTELPSARIHISRYPEGIISICSIDGDNCQELVRTKTFVHGYLDDAIITPDGMSILWSVLTNRPDMALGNGQGIIENVIAFETDIITSKTTPIFDLEDYVTSDEKGIETRWSAEGAVAIEITSTDGHGRGTLIVTFGTS